MVLPGGALLQIRLNGLLKSFPIKFDQQKIDLDDVSIGVEAFAVIGCW